MRLYYIAGRGEKEIHSRRMQRDGLGFDMVCNSDSTYAVHHASVIYSGKEFED